MDKFLYREESYTIRGVAYEIYKQFRNNHKESVYHNAFLIGLHKKGLSVERNKRVDIFYENKKVGTYTPDAVVNGCILVELKAKPYLTKDDIKQFWYYLKGTTYKAGYLINFGPPNGIEIIRRVYDTARHK